MKLTKKLLLAIIIVLTTLVIAPKVVPELQSANSVQATNTSLNKWLDEKEKNKYSINVKGTKISLNKKTQTIYEGNTYTLKVIGTKTKAKWSSSNKKVATVNSNGKVTAKENGTAIITARVGNKKLTCKVNVRLMQFNETFYSIENASKAYIKVSKIKTSKTYKYDLDGDRKKDTIIISNNNGEYSIKLNGKEFSRLDNTQTIYIVDLNKNDKTTQVVIKEEEATCNYYIFSKTGSEMKELKIFYGNNKSQIKINKKGKLLYDSGYISFSPKAYGQYYVFNNNKFITKKLNISKKTFIITGDTYFTTNKKVINADLADGLTYDTLKVKQVKKNTKFKILKFINEKIINVQLANGQTGYLFVSGI